jgi:hypothetical protein
MPWWARVVAIFGQNMILVSIILDREQLWAGLCIWYSHGCRHKQLQDAPLQCCWSSTNSPSQSHLRPWSIAQCSSGPWPSKTASAVGLLNAYHSMCTLGVYRNKSVKTKFGTENICTHYSPWEHSIGLCCALWQSNQITLTLNFEHPIWFLRQVTEFWNTGSDGKFWNFQVDTTSSQQSDAASPIQCCWSGC